MSKSLRRHRAQENLIEEQATLLLALLQDMLKPAMASRLSDGTRKKLEERLAAIEAYLAG